MNNLKGQVQTIMYTLDLLEKQYDYRALQTALALWVRNGSKLSISNEDLEELSDYIYDMDGSLLNGDLVDYIDFI